MTDWVPHCHAPAQSLRSRGLVQGAPAQPSHVFCLQPPMTCANVMQRAGVELYSSLFFKLISNTEGSPRVALGLWCK